MKKLLICFILFSYLFPKEIQAQRNNDAAGVAGAIGAAVGVAIAIEQMKEQIELKATEYVINTYPELDKFSLKILRLNGKKISDMSSTSVIIFKIREFDINTDKETVWGKKMVLFAFTSNGWVNQYGVNFNKIKWHLINIDEWLNMMTSYSKLASGEEDASKIKETLKNGWILNKGIKAKLRRKDNIDFYKIEGDMYLVADYSSDFKFIYNERSLGIYLKETGDLVQIGRNDLIDIHNNFITEDDLQ